MGMNLLSSCEKQREKERENPMISDKRDEVEEVVVRTTTRWRRTSTEEARVSTERMPRRTSFWTPSKGGSQPLGL
jgi:hypothetical protein